MAKPLRSADVAPRSVQFAHFGVLDDGAQSKTSTLTSVSINVLLAFVIIVIGAATKKISDNRIKLTELTAPVLIKKEPEPPKIIPKPPKLPELPKVVLQPKITIPQVKLPDPPKPLEVKMEQPKPVLLPAAPLKVVAPPAPKFVSLANPQAASVPNNSAHPTAVALGRPDNPIAPTASGAASVNLGNRGLAGMPSGNTGAGNPTKVVLGGNGQPTGTAMTGANGPVQVAGIPHGTPGGTGTASRGPAVVQIGQVTPPPMPKPASGLTQTAQRSAPKVLYKPKPVYSAEAIQMHLEGVVSVRIRVLANGAVEVVGVTSGLGHGLDESAIRAVQSTKFQPAVDSSGTPVPWDGVVNVAFQLAG